MENSVTFNTVLERLHEAEQILRIGAERGSLTAIERDILLEKLRVSYDQILFDKINGPIVSPKFQDFSAKTQKIEVPPTPEVVITKPKIDIPPVVPPKAVEKPAITETPKPKIEELPKVEAQVIVEPPKAIVTPKEELPTTEEFTLDIEEIVEDSTPKASTEKPKEEILHTPQTEEISRPDHLQSGNGLSDRTAGPTLGEKFQGTRTFRNETLGKSKKDVASVLKNKPIVDLTKAIGINDKFLFTKELFNGNAELYAKSIIKLNEFTDINDALIFIQENFSWDEKNEAANQLIELVRRKLMYE